ncbi:type IV pilus biogenesis/stability protein PilW [Corallincola platygyrae]|uniref:Type IV pilus biogenesis/stability protein PilW n=1 Tax=Corallincola platygyrae TaxID=1193278 RepID=A0ABW4XJP7_9GAMM
MLFRIFVLLLSVITLGGCVTETTYPDRDKNAQPSEPDSLSAAKARIALGLRYLKNGDYDQAKFNLTKALDHSPNNIEANYTMGYYYQVVKENELAEDYYKRAISLDSSNGDVRNTYGVFLCSQNRFEEAELQFLKAVESKTYFKVADSYENAALCARSNGQPDKAVEYFDKALTHAPNRAKSLLGLSELSWENGDRKRSESLLTRYHKSYSFSARSTYLALLQAYAKGDVMAEKKYGGILTAKFPASEQAKKYVLREYR